MKFKSINDAVINCEVSLMGKVSDKVKSFAKNINGSETTEKIGWVVGAAVLVGVAVTAIKTWVPGAFSEILAQVKSTVLGIGG